MTLTIHADIKTKPTLKDLVNELREVTNIHGLGIQLEVPSAKLREFEANYSQDLERQKIELVEFWLRTQVNASWNLLVEALHNNGDVCLSARIKKKYLPGLFLFACVCVTYKEVDGRAKVVQARCMYGSIHSCLTKEGHTYVQPLNNI